MKVTFQYALQKFNEYNQLCFDNCLPQIPIRISNSRRALGMFVHPRNYPESAPRGVGECSLRISCRLDLPPNEVDDTIIHEMIHYYIWYEKLKDTSSHGPIFRKIMNQINTRYHRNISISHKCSAEEISSDTYNRNNYICVSRWRNGEVGITICARTKIFEINRIFKTIPDLLSLEWYWSRNPWFNKYPVSRTSKVYKIKPDELVTNLSTATPCEIINNIFQPKSH